MKNVLPLLCTFALLFSMTLSQDEHARESLNSGLQMIEADYVDRCAEKATSTWAELVNTKDGLSKKLERDKYYGHAITELHDDTKFLIKGYTFSDDEELTKRKIKLMMQPGDVLLDTNQWIELVDFADNAEHNLRFSNNYDCGANVNCSLQEFYTSYSRETDMEKSIRMKKSWKNNLPDMNKYMKDILPLLRNSSKGFQTTEEYWNFLVEYEGAILKGRELWKQLEPLYKKFYTYISSTLTGADSVGKPLPVHLLRSLTGDDWSNVIDHILPPHPAMYHKLQETLVLKNLGGLNAYEVAAKLISDLNLGEIKENILKESLFNGSCPATLVDWCQPNKVRFVTCKDVSIGNYLDAHETAMKVVYKQTTALFSNNTYLLREAPRYSAIYEAIPGFVSLMALTPHAIDANGIFPLEKFNYNPNHHRLVLQLVLALRDLPKLNYYLAADEWRLQILTEKASSAKISSSWSEYRKKFSLLETSDIDILADPYVLFNKPLIGKFMGIILKYQIYQSFAEELESDESDLIKHVAKNSNRLRDIMIRGYERPWPELVSDLLAEKENGLEYTAVTDYYRLLDDFLFTKLDPSVDGVEVIDDYDDPSEDTNIISDDDDDNGNVDYPSLDGAIPQTVSYTTTEVITEEYKPTTEKALGVLDKDKKEKGEDVSANEKSYNAYWWIGIGVALTVVAILIAIIARKRSNHRKELEKQRRETSRA